MRVRKRARTLKRGLERESEIVISERDRKYVRQVPLSFEMPVGCLGAPAPPSPASREAPASLAEKMELMQQTLLIQIFRMESSTSLSCSTCSSFSRTCCQVDSGWQVVVVVDVGAIFVFVVVAVDTVVVVVVVAAVVVIVIVFAVVLFVVVVIVVIVIVTELWWAGPLLSGCHQLKSCVESSAYQGCQLASTSGAPYSRSFLSLLQESVCCSFRCFFAQKSNRKMCTSSPKCQFWRWKKTRMMHRSSPNCAIFSEMRSVTAYLHLDVHVIQIHIQRKQTHHKFMKILLFVGGQCNSN